MTPDGTLHLVPNHGVKWLTACPSAAVLSAVDGVRSVQLSEDTLQAGLELEVWLDRSGVEVYVNGGSDILVAVSKVRPLARRPLVRRSSLAVFLNTDAFALS